MKASRLLPRLVVIATLFATLVSARPPATAHAALTLEQVRVAMEMESLSYPGSTGPMTISAVAPNPGATVYTIKVNAPLPSCLPDSGCETDRFAIRYNSTISNIYGLGMQEFAYQVKVADVVDNSFGSGHARPQAGAASDSWGTEGKDRDKQFNSDVGRMRTPILILPEKGTIIAYIQPALKVVSVVRDGSLACPAGMTCIDLKKRPLNADGTPDVSGAKGELILVKGMNISNAYAAFYTYMRDYTQGRFYFKSPRREAFGPVWETWDELGCTANRLTVTSAISQHLAKNITPSAAIIGSGYWDAENYPGCPAPPPQPGQPPAPAETNQTAMDTMVVSPERYGGKPGLEDLFGEMLNNGIYPMLGMRHQVFPEFPDGTLNDQIFDNFDRIQSAMAAWDPTITNPYLPNPAPNQPPNRYFGNGFEWTPADPSVPPPAFRLLNMQSAKVIRAWFYFVRYGMPGTTLAGYASNVRGFKEDDMHFADQQRLKAFAPLNQQIVHNLPDGLTSQTYRVYNQEAANDFLIFGRNDWFSVGTDGQITQGYVRNSPDTASQPPFYTFKYVLDSALTQVTSGYPHPASEYIAFANSKFGTPTTFPTQTLEFLRGAQLRTFFGVTLSSRGYWRLQGNQHYQDSIIYYQQLRARLQQYAYDQAQTWYETGVPTLMQPLYIKWPSDPNVHKLYGTVTNTLTPTNQFMFGNALLIRPMLSADMQAKVYLPQGTWRPFMKDNLGGQPPIIADANGQVVNYVLDTNNGTATGAQDYPMYLKEKEVLIIGAYNAPKNLQAYVFMECAKPSIEADCTSNPYRFHKSDGTVVTLRATWDGSQVRLGRVVNTTVVESVPMTLNNKGFYTAAIATLID